MPDPTRYLIVSLIWLEPVLAGAGVVGSGLFVATLVHGRTGPVPSLAWAGTALATWLATSGVWWLDARGVGAAASRWRSAAWPSLALVPPTTAVLGLYLDDRSNHLVTLYPPIREALLGYAILLYALAQGAYWAGVVVRRQAAASAARAAAPPLIVALAGAAYVNASLFVPWVPPQADLLTNLRGARDLLAGVLPYDDTIPVWADRVHLLPATLAFLFAPLTLLGDSGARLVFFLINQALWLGAVGVFVRRLVAPCDRVWWYAGALFVGATYWPWQEAIRFGQQDGLLTLLFVATITSAGRGRWLQSGLALGVAFVVKPLSVWLPLAYAVHRRWRTLALAGAAAAVLAVASLPITGSAPWQHFVEVEVPEMFPGTVRGTNIPLQSVHARLFVERERLRDGDPAPSLPVISGLNLAANLLGLLLVAHLARRAPRFGLGVDRTWLLDASVGLTLTLLLAPMAWQHYASWLIVAFGVLALPAVWRPLSPARRAMSGGLAGASYLLLSLDDARLLPRIAPLVERWPAVMSFYALGLLLLLGALVAARFGERTPP